MRISDGDRSKYTKKPEPIMPKRGPQKGQQRLKGKKRIGGKLVHNG